MFKRSLVGCAAVSLHDGLIIIGVTKHILLIFHNSLKKSLPFYFGFHGKYSTPEYWSNPTMAVFKGQYIVLVSAVGTYIDSRYIKHFSTNKCHHFDWMERMI